MKIWLLMLILMLCGVSSARAEQLRFAPFKDDLFAYAKVLETGANGAFRLLEYDELRDVIGRDVLPGRMAKRQYVLRVRGGVRQLALTGDKGVRVLFQVAGAEAERATINLAYIHGNGGNRKQGMNIRSFGGNFGRLQNLVLKAGGRYLSPGFADFGAKGEAQLALLISHAKSKSPNAPFVLACGSQGSLLCWRLAKSDKIGPLVDGLVILGGWTDPALLKLPKPLPVFIAHGSRDPIAPWQERKNFLDSVLASNPNYPIRMDLFDGGIHGTPIRMVDWRLVLNWIAEKVARNG